MDDLVAKYQTSIVYQPAYSPDFNPIGKARFVLKSKVRHIIAQSNKTFQEALDIAFRSM